MTAPATITLAPEVAAFIRAQPRALPYSALAAACREAFGPERAPDADTIRQWWLRESGAAPRGKIGRDPEIVDAIRDHLGRLNPTEIMEALRARFAPERLPSRSALYRFVERERTAVIVAEARLRRKATSGP